MGPHGPHPHTGRRTKVAKARFPSVHDPASKLSGAEGICTGAEVTAGTVNGAAVDLQGKHGAIFIVSVGTVNTSGTVNASLEDSPDNSAWTAVNTTLYPESVITEMDTSDQDSEVMSYSHGNARWVRPVVVVAVAAVDVAVGVASF